MLCSELKCIIKPDDLLLNFIFPIYINLENLSFKYSHFWLQNNQSGDDQTPDMLH